MAFLRVLKNKYLIVTLLFLTWVFFFAQYDILSLFRQKKELQEMNEKIRYMQEEVQWMENEKKAILTDSSVMERYAREKYFMKTPNEEVYVFDTISSTTSQSVKKH